MFYRYSKFELKILLMNKKQLFLGLILMIFFLAYFYVHINSDPPTLLMKKYEETEKQSILVNTLPLDLRDTEEGREIFENYTKQLSLINMQIFYLNSDYGRKTTQYVADGLLLNKLRLEMHEQDNPHISKGLAIPVAEIEKENEFLNYLAKNNMLEEDKPFQTSQFLLAATEMLSGIFLFIIILLICSDMLVYENEHTTVLRALPVSFRTKAISKVTLYYSFIALSFLLGLALGIWYSATKEGMGNLSYPTLIYSDGNFMAIPIIEYLLYALLGILIAILMVVILTLVLNVFVQNMYGVVLAGLAVFFLPDLLYLIGIKAKILYPIKYIDIAGVLSGDLALAFNDVSINYWNSIFSMLGFILVLILILFLYNWYSFRQKRA